MNLSAPLEKLNVHVRGGSIIPIQIPGPNLMLGHGNHYLLLHPNLAMQMEICFGMMVIRLKQKHTIILNLI